MKYLSWLSIWVFSACYQTPVQFVEIPQACPTPKVIYQESDCDPCETAYQALKDENNHLYDALGEACQ